MKKLLLSLSLFSLVLSGFTQVDVALKINHKLGVDDFSLDATSINNLGQSFTVSRLEYYLTRVTIIHDGGSETVVPDEIVALVRPMDEVSTTINLGNFDVTEIEAVKFHIGVYSPVNTADPAVWAVSHPLGMKSPSMHWGWASGYRFIAYEGVSGADGFQLHGLGDENYFETTSEVAVENVDGTLIMELNGNYTEGLRDISLPGGTISHGTTGEAKQALENWRDRVFGLYTVGLEEESASINWSVFPNPSTGTVNVNFKTLDDIKQVQVLNPLGEIVHSASINSTTLELTIENTGVYFVTVLNSAGEIITNKRIVIN